MPIYITNRADFECEKKMFDIQDEKNSSHHASTSVCNGCFIINRFDKKNHPIKLGYYPASFGDQNKEWFDIEIIGIESVMSMFLKFNKSIQNKKAICSKKCYLCEKNF